MEKETWEDCLFHNEEGRRVERRREEEFGEFERAELRRFQLAELIRRRFRRRGRYTFDSEFAQDFFQALPEGTLPTQYTPVQCCNCCKSILDPKCNINLSEVRAAEKGCQLCALVLCTLRRYGINDDEHNAQIVRKDSELKVGGGGPRIFWLCSNSDSVDTKTHIQMGFPFLSENISSARFQLLRAWLHRCDQSHDCNKRDGISNQTLPTRLLWVGEPDNQHYDANFLRLNTATDTSGGKYMALSHCWGELPTEVKKHFCTTSDNISRRQRGFSIWELPRTFQDAIRVTRELRVPYLWVDSLCIIQYGDNGDDWRHESRRMEEVFSGAYCTIAATSASNSSTGFLQPNVKHNYIHVQDTSSNRFYISAGIDDFNNDVEEALLNKRAWVMQERILSRRTIHFSTNLIYWECGGGVYCENLTVMKTSFRKEFFMLDPDFPNRLLTSSHQRTMDFIHFLFENYSKRGLTEKTDRCVATSGLEARIARALGCKSRYGIFETYLHRNLLWQRSDTKLEKIVYETQHVPSWSWMAYNGGIQFFHKDIPFGTVDWIDNLRFDEGCKHALIADVGRFRDGTELDGKHAVLDSSGVKRGWVRYDVETDKDKEREGLCEERCVIAGKKTKNDVKEYYVLVVRPAEAVDDEYKRVGVGLIQSDCVVRERASVQIV